MPKPNVLADIFSLLTTPSVPQEKNYFLFLLGTDTVFTRRPTLDYSYENGETLSYAAQAVVTQLGEQAELGQKGDVLSYSSPSVDVLNGPTTLGTEVGDRVAQAVFLALRAIASGKETIQIPAHSRGAVEAILVVNELARIKKELSTHPDKSLFDILASAPANEDNTYIAEAVRKLFKNPDNESLEARQALLAKLEKVKVNPFLMDPVPGGSKYGIKKIRWHSRRFYEELATDNCELLLFRDERTCCFTPIVPEGIQPLVLPGHHGTASGNRYNQQGVEVPASIMNRDTTTMQSLVLCKLFNFLNHSTNGRFDSDSYQKLSLEHKKLDPVLDSFLSAPEAKRRELLLGHYVEVQKNDEAFRSFSNGSYGYLGSQYTNDKQRYVHFRGHNHSSMLNVAPSLNDSFLNEEHARLYLRQYINFDGLIDSSIDEAVSQVTTILTKAIKQLVEPSETLEIDGEVARLLALLEDERGAEIFFNGLSLLVDTMSQKYLRNNLTAEQDERLRNIIAEPFRIINEAKAKLSEANQINPKHRGYIERIDDIIKNGIKNTVETHYKSITQQIDFIETQLTHRELPEAHFSKAFQIFANRLTQGENLPDELAILRTRLNELPQSAIKDINSIQEAISSAVKDLNIEDSARLEKIEDIISRKSAKYLQPCFEAHETSIEDYLKNIERLYNLVITLQKDLPSLQNLASENRIVIEPKQLHYRKLDLMEMAGKLLKNNQVDLSEKPAYLSEDFFSLIKNEAIKSGAPSPEIKELKSLAKELHSITVTQNKMLKEQVQDISALVNKQEILHEHIQLQKKALAVQTELVAEQETQLAQHKTALTNKDKLINEQQATILHGVGDKDKLISRLASDEETEHASLIKNKLLPLTTTYLTHLFKEANAIYPGLKLKSDGSLPELGDTREDRLADFNKIANKFAVVLQLKHTLEDKENTPLPSARVEKFKNALLSAEAENLKIHRDAAWVRFIKTGLAILGIIATGVVPALSAMMLYSAVTDRKNPLFFNHYTRGDAYISQCNSEIASLPLPVNENGGQVLLESEHVEPVEPNHLNI